MADVHPTAIVEPGASLHETAVVEAFAVVGAGVSLGPKVRIKSHALVEGLTTIREGSVVWPGACVGTPPQDLKYRGEETELEIGERCQIRECATINRPTAACGRSSIGPDCLIMSHTHIAHDCQLAEKVIMSNGAMLAGHVCIEAGAIIGGKSAVHQFSRVGAWSMVGGMSRVTRDVPPFTVGAGAPYRLGGINLVGLQRRSVDLEVRRVLALAFRLTFRTHLPLSEALLAVEDQCPRIPEIEHWLRFCRSSRRGIIGREGRRRKESVESWR